MIKSSINASFLMTTLMMIKLLIDVLRWVTMLIMTWFNDIVIWMMRIANVDLFDVYESVFYEKFRLFFRCVARRRVDVNQRVFWVAIIVCNAMLKNDEHLSKLNEILKFWNRLNIEYETWIITNVVVKQNDDYYRRNAMQTNEFDILILY